MEIETILFTDKEELINTEITDIVVGGVGRVKQFLENKGIIVKDIDYPECLSKFYGRKIWETTSDVFLSENNNFPLFIKPKQGKLFTGFICINENDIAGRFSPKENIPVYCSEVKDIITEWRCFVRYGKILDIRRYKGELGRIYSLQKVKEMISSYSDEPTAYSIDIGLTAGNETFEGSLDTQRQLLADYKEDIRKYAEGVDQTRILNVFNRIAPQLAKENKKFQISKVASGARFRDYRGCIDWLVDADIVNPCYCLNFPELPLKGNYDDDKFKLYFADSGLLVAMLDDEAQDDLRANKNLGVYKGALYENIVGEALVKSGCDLYYYRREDSTLEQDFFMRTKDSLVPVEVKAENGRAKSLKTLINSDKYTDIIFGVKLFNGNVGYSDNVYSFPYFCAFLIKEFLQTK